MKNVFTTLLITVLLVSVLGISFVIADPAIPIENTRPIITLTYEEQVYIEYANLTDSHGGVYELIVTPALGSYSSVFTIQPIQHLSNQEYYLTVVASDEVGNNVTTFYEFIVEADYMWMRAKEPPLGISQIEVFNATIETEKISYCKYGLSASGVRIFEFDNEPIQGDTEHMLLNVNNDSGYLGNINSETTIYLKCIDTDGRTHLGNVILGYDPTAPTLTVIATPNPVIDVETRNTTLRVESNDDVICKYNNEQFAGYDVDNFSAYHKIHEEVIKYNLTPNLEPESFDYEIICWNRAGLTTNLTYTVNVEFEETINIEMTSPGEYTNAADVVFTIETSIKATDGCQYSTNSVNWSDFTLIENNNKRFKVSLGNLDEKSYTYYAECTSSFGKDNESFTFTVDRTDPSKPTITVPDPSCSLSRLRAEFIATDTSGIGYYNYSVSYNGSLVVPWKTSTSGDVSESLDLDEGETYTWNVVAVDKAGNIGAQETKTVKPRDPDTYDACDDEEPEFFIDIIRTNSTTYLNITCSDDESGCTDEFEYDLATNLDNCSPETTEDYGETIEVTTTSYFCMIGYDEAGNNNTETKHIVIEGTGGTCSNGVKDDNETDVDCGGPCGSCSLGESCTSSTDCISNNCVSGVCTSANCNDNSKNGDETDVDCGGSLCGPCDVGESCDYNVDCTTNYCNNESICEETSCTDSVKNGGETDVDCGGPCDPCINGNTCNYNTDCVSGYCESGTCKIYSGDESTTDGKKGMPFWFLIAGIILFLAGLGYMLYSRIFSKKKKTTKPIQEPRIQNYTQQQNRASGPTRSPEERERSLNELKMGRQVARERAVKKKQSRSDIMKAFETGEKGKETETSKNNLSKKTSPETKDNSSKDDENTKKKGFISLEELSAEDSKKKKTLKKEDTEGDVFQKLKAITLGKDTALNKSSGSSGKGKDSEKAKKDIKTKILNDLPELKPPTKPKGLKPKTPSLSEEDIFQKLTEITGQSNNNVKKAINKDKIKRNDMLNIFANVTEKKQLDMDVFKAILSTLLTQSKIDKKEVSAILFDFYDKQLLTKKELYTTLKELKLV